MKQLLDLVYPRHCPICGQVLPLWQKETLCEACVAKPPFLTDRLCARCGIPLDLGEGKLCRRCLSTKDCFTQGFAAFPYEEIRQGLFLYKFHGERYLGEIYANLMVRHFLSHGPEQVRAATLLIPIPLHEKKQKQRGFNQAKILASGLSSALDIPMADVLVRTKSTLPQSGLSPRERRENLKSAFKVKPDLRIDGAKVLLMDDIFTTGSTINACASVLKEAGALEIYFYTLSVAHGPKE